MSRGEEEARLWGERLLSVGSSRIGMPFLFKTLTRTLGKSRGSLSNNNNDSPNVEKGAGEVITVQPLRNRRWGKFNRSTG